MLAPKIPTMSTQPRISVVMPTYNRPALLARALDSLAAQTYGDFEVVVVNDAGLPVDDVIEAARTRIAVTFVEHERNRGRCGALNTALDAARGELVAFLDDDDIYYAHHLQTLVDALADRSITAVYSHAVKVVENEAGAITHRELVGATDFDSNLLQVNNFIVGMSVLVPLADVRAVGGFDSDLRVLEDWELWIKLSERVRFEHVAVPTAEYRWRPGKGNQTVREWFRFHESLELIYAKHPLPAGSPLAAPRASMLANSSGRAEAYSYELSVVVLCESDLAAGIASIQEYATEFSGTDQVELVLAVPDMTSWAPLVEGLSGDVQAFSTGELAGDEVLGFLRSRVSGRRMALLRAGESLDMPRVAALLGRPGGMAEVGRAA